MKLIISEEAEAIGFAAAKELLGEIDRFSTTNEKKKMIVGLSSGRTMERVYRWTVELLKDRIRRGEAVSDFSKVTFVQTEAFYPEDPKSEHGLMARQISEQFINRLEEIVSQKIEVFYPGLENSLEDMREKFTHLTKEMDIDFVTLHESGAAKGLRDADMKEGEIRPKWAQGRMQTRDMQLRPINEIVAGESIRPDMVRTEQEKPLSEVMNQITDRISEGDRPTHFVTEGYDAYKKAKKVIIVTEGENKAIAVKRLFSNIRLAKMDKSVQHEISRNRRSDAEGTASGATVVDIRRGENTEMYIDRRAASEIDEDRLRSLGVEICHFKWEDDELKRELGTDFSWDKVNKIK